MGLIIRGASVRSIVIVRILEINFDHQSINQLINLFRTKYSIDFDNRHKGEVEFEKKMPQNKSIAKT